MILSLLLVIKEDINLDCEHLSLWHSPNMNFTAVATNFCLEEGQQI